MNRLTVILATCVKFASLILLANAAQGAEYSAGDDFPQATSIVFTQGAVALTIVSNRYSINADHPDESSYFVAYRPDLEFQQVELAEYTRLTDSEHVEHRVDYRASNNFEVEDTQDCIEAGYRWDSGPRDIKGRVTVKIDDQSYEVDLLCQSDIPHAMRFGNDLWIGTVEHGDHGYYGSEGVLVVSGDDGTTTQIDTGFYPVLALVKDPWSSQIWVVTEQQIARMGGGGEVLARYWKYHDFDAGENRPAIFVTDSDEPIEDHSLALLARVLGESSYEFLSHERSKGVKLPGEEPLYVMNMFGRYYAHRAAWPAELEKLLDVATPNHAWRIFACLTSGSRAKALCELDVSEWPQANQNSPEKR